MAKPTKKGKGKGKKSANDKAPKTEAKGKKKSKKKDEAPHILDVPHKKKTWCKEREIDPRTGTRFKPNTSQQLAFDITLKGAQKGHNVKKIRETLKAERKDNGGQRDLDAGYFNFVAAVHPEFFQVWSDGRVEIIAEPQPDPDAIKKMKADEKARKERASKARGTVTRKKPAKGKAKPTKKGKKGKKVLKKK
jgi:hypothetical protein